MYVSSIRQREPTGRFLPFRKIASSFFNATLFHHVGQIAIAQRVGQVPPNADQDEVFFETMAFKVDHSGVRDAVRGRHSLPTPKLSPLMQQNQRWRGIATRYAKNIASFLAAIQIRCIAIGANIS
jgi:hypothetical protein